jgi:hypothetical protein
MAADALKLFTLHDTSGPCRVGRLARTNQPSSKSNASVDFGEEPQGRKSVMIMHSKGNDSFSLKRSHHGLWPTNVDS